MNVHYQNQGNYQLPCIATKEQKELHNGAWANRHRQYLKQHHQIRYYNLLTTERLYPYLADIEEQAQTMFSQLVKSLAEKENVTEKLKADNPMLWVQKMNSIRNRAMEVVNGEQSNPYRYMCNADLLLITSFNEAAPMIIDEAYCLGLPILSTATTSTKEMILNRGCGWVCDNSQFSINRSLVEILRNRSVIEYVRSQIRYTDVDNINPMKQFAALIGD